MSDLVDQKFMDLAFRIAESQTQKFGKFFSAILVYRNRVISVGSNLEKTHPFAVKFGRNQSAIFWHAETHAIYNATRNNFTTDEFRKSTLYVCRLKKPKARAKQFVTGLAKPCLGCLSCVNVFGIPRVVYSVDGGKFECIQN